MWRPLPSARCLQLIPDSTVLHPFLLLVPTMIGTVIARTPKGVPNRMYRHSHSFLGLAALTGGLHSGGVHVIWATVLAATIVGAAVSVSHIALGLGVPHPHVLRGALRRHFAHRDDAEERARPATS